MTLLPDKIYSEMYQKGLVICDDPHSKMYECFIFDKLEVEYELTTKTFQDLITYFEHSDLVLDKKLFMFEGCNPGYYWYVASGKRAKEILHYEVKVEFVNRQMPEEFENPEFTDYENSLFERVGHDFEAIEFDDSTHMQRVLACAKFHGYHEEMELIPMNDHLLYMIDVEVWKRLQNHFLDNFNLVEWYERQAGVNMLGTKVIEKLFSDIDYLQKFLNASENIDDKAAASILKELND